MTSRSYRASLRTRLSTLFSPIRLTLGLASIAWFVVTTALYLGRGNLVDWLGPLSVIPLLTFKAWTVATDMRYRREDTAPDDD